MNTSRPYCADKIAALCVLAEVVLLNAFFVDIVVFFNLDTSVNNGNQMNALCLHFL
ncbi:unknown [Ruminococcus sp. CAG:330]|nr:unknown [Ruminococcus sp. CAG:330]